MDGEGRLGPAGYRLLRLRAEHLLPSWRRPLGTRALLDPHCAPSSAGERLGTMQALR